MNLLEKKLKQKHVYIQQLEQGYDERVQTDLIKSASKFTSWETGHEVSDFKYLVLILLSLITNDHKINQVTEN